MSRSKAEIEAARMNDELPPYDAKCPGCQTRAQRMQKYGYLVEDLVFEMEDRKAEIKLLTEQCKELKAKNVELEGKLTGLEKKHNESTRRLTNAMRPALALVARYARIKSILAAVFVGATTLAGILANIPASWWEKVFKWFF